MNLIFFLFALLPARHILKEEALLQSRSLHISLLLTQAAAFLSFLPFPHLFFPTNTRQSS